MIYDFYICNTQPFLILFLFPYILTITHPCCNTPDHHIKLVNSLPQRLVGEDSSVPYDDAGFTAQTVQQKHKRPHDLSHLGSKITSM